MNALKSLWGPKTEEVDEEIPESVDGVEERNLHVVGMKRGPMFTIAEWRKLKSCERPCSKEEWGNEKRTNGKQWEIWDSHP